MKRGSNLVQLILVPSLILNVCMFLRESVSRNTSNICSDILKNKSDEEPQPTLARTISGEIFVYKDRQIDSSKIRNFKQFEQKFVSIWKDWSFDDTVSSSYNCVVRAFDPSIGLENHTRTTEYGSTVHFNNIGIDGNDTIRKGEQQGDWVMRKFSTIYAELDGHERQPTVDYLKMDVEGSEVDAIEAMYSEGVLDRIKQLGLEIHPLNNTEVMIKTWKMLRLLEKSGFKKWHFHLNVEGPWNSDSAMVTFIDHIPIDNIM